MEILKSIYNTFNIFNDCITTQNQLIKENKTILLTGLHNSGKTTILYRLLKGKLVNTSHTPGYNVETIKSFKHFDLTVWDVGGFTRANYSYHHYTVGAIAIVFVIDCTDPTRMKDAKEELHTLVNEKQLDDAKIFLIIANKQDHQDKPYMGNGEIIKSLDLHSISLIKHLRLFHCSAINDDSKINNIIEPFEWLEQQILIYDEIKNNLDSYKNEDNENYNK